LSGPPGTGKTLTAEAVADKTRRPLYYLQAEDLGTNAAFLGPKIKKVFEMATEWDAVILLDGKQSPPVADAAPLTSCTEADVFMAERSPADIARNELVSSKNFVAHHLVTKSRNIDKHQSSSVNLNTSKAPSS